MKCYSTRWLAAIFLGGALLACAWGTSEAKPLLNNTKPPVNDGDPDELPTSAGHNGQEGQTLLVSILELGDSGAPFPKGGLGLAQRDDATMPTSIDVPERQRLSDGRFPPTSG